MEVYGMKKYNTPEFKITMFDVESVKTSEPASNSSTSFDAAVTAGTMAAKQIDWSTATINWSF